MLLFIFKLNPGLFFFMNPDKIENCFFCNDQIAKKFINNYSFLHPTIIIKFE